MQDEDQSVKRKRGRPRKYSKSELSPESSVKRKRGRPRKDTSLGIVAGSSPDVQVAEASVTDDVEVHDRSRVERRGRPKKWTDGASHGQGTSGKEATEMKLKVEHPADRIASRRAISHHKGHSQALSLLPMAESEVAKHSPSMDTVVKVFCVHTEPNFSLPWQMKHQLSSNSSGFIISGRRLLTNAHSVQHHTQVRVKRHGSDTKFLATVLAIGTECDIALLTVDSDEFWEGVSPVEFGALPSLQDAVTVVGYPIGGDTISVTSGVVSRIEVTSYVHGATELLGVQIDAAINAGNSGGPAFNDRGQCVGIAFQSLKYEDAENIGYVIPTPVITHFINDYELNGDYTGFPILGVDWQKLENPDLRSALHMPSHLKGVRVRRVEPTAPAAESLQASDILLSFDGINIANDGTVPFRHEERIGFSYLVSQKYTGEQARIGVLRRSVITYFDIKLEAHKRFVPTHIRGRPPSYYIIGGIVFTPVSVPYLRSEYGKDYDYGAPVKLLDKLLHSMAETEDEQLVVVSQVLVADINIGYEDIVNTQIISFNGTLIKNLKHLAHMVETCKETFLKFDLEYQQMVVLETEKAKEASLEILAIHCIPSAMSEDLKS